MDTPKGSTDAMKKIALMTTLYSVFMICSQIVGVIQGNYNLNHPLLPKYLIKYIAFPLVFIVPFFGAIGFLSFRAYKNDNRQPKVVISCLIMAMIYFLFQVQIYSFIQSVNPYGG